MYKLKVKQTAVKKSKSKRKSKACMGVESESIYNTRICCIIQSEQNYY